MTTKKRWEEIQAWNIEERKAKVVLDPTKLCFFCRNTMSDTAFSVVKTEEYPPIERKELVLCSFCADILCSELKDALLVIHEFSY